MVSYVMVGGIVNELPACALFGFGVVGWWGSSGFGVLVVWLLD